MRRDKKKSERLDRRMEKIIGILLRTGVIVSSIIVLYGGFIYIDRHGSEPARYHVFQEEPFNMRDAAEIAGKASEGDGRSLIQLGILLLILTPVCRVAFSAAFFALENDYLYLIVTLFVLALILENLIVPK